MISLEYIETVRRHRRQMLKVARALKRSKLDLMALVLYQMADDVTELIRAAEEQIIMADEVKEPLRLAEGQLAITETAE